MFSEKALPAGESFSAATFSLLPKEGDVEDFDTEVALSAENFGTHSSNVKAEGSVTVGEDTVGFSVPIEKAAVLFELGKKSAPPMDGLKLDFEMLSWNEKEFGFKFDRAGFTADKALGDDVMEELLAAIESDVLSLKKELTTSVGGDLDSFQDFPMEPALPLAMVYMATPLMEKLSFDEDFVNFGASVEHFGLLSDKQKTLLKPIEAEFAKEQNVRGESAMFQFSIDDNLFNSLTAFITSIDRTFGLRDFTKGNPKAAEALAMLTTNNLGTVLPDFVEDYGEGKKVDLHFSPSHSLFLDGLPGSKMTGINIDKNGNWKVQINICMNIAVETSPGNWENARTGYGTVVFKMKIKQDDSNPFNKVLSFTPKSLEISQLKIMKGEEEATTEQMMLQSMANL